MDPWHRPVSSSEGAYGRRGDGSDGHSWAGGLGALVDLKGNDRHEGERAGLAFGHDFTHALLVNLGGNDHYACKGDGIGFSINRSYALLIDVGGDGEGGRGVGRRRDVGYLKGGQRGPRTRCRRGHGGLSALPQGGRR